MLKLCCFLLLMISPAIQAGTDPVDTIADLLKKGNVHELSKLFSSSVELTILKDEGIYSNTQAELILDHFFKK